MCEVKVLPKKGTRDSGGPRGFGLLSYCGKKALECIEMTESLISLVCQKTALLMRVKGGPRWRN